MRFITLYYNSNYKRHNVTLYTIHDTHLKHASNALKINKILCLFEKMKLASSKYKIGKLFLGFMAFDGEINEDDIIIARFKI